MSFLTMLGGETEGSRAVWTRFHPLGYKVQELLFSGKLGKVKRFSADFSMNGPLDGESRSEQWLRHEWYG